MKIKPKPKICCSAGGGITNKIFVMKRLLLIVLSASVLLGAMSCSVLRRPAPPAMIPAPTPVEEPTAFEVKPEVGDTTDAMWRSLSLLSWDEGDSTRTIGNLAFAVRQTADNGDPMWVYTTPSPGGLVGVTFNALARTGEVMVIEANNETVTLPFTLYPGAMVESKSGVSFIFGKN
jgi:hypothetical protein